MGEAMAESILVDWGGLTGSGEPLPYSPATAKALLTDPQYRPLLYAVTCAAGVVNNTRATETEALAKKLASAVLSALSGGVDGAALLPGAEFYLESFWEIATCRPVGFGPAPIPFTAIDA